MTPNTTNSFGPKVLANIENGAEFTLSLSRVTHTLYLEWQDQSGLAFTFNDTEMQLLMKWATERVICNTASTHL